MPKLVNKNPHGVRVTDANGVEHRLRKGQVVDVDGAAADALTGVSNVSSASKADEEAWRERCAVGSHPDAQPGDGFDNIVADAREAVNQATIVAPLNTVIGDSDAPHGPPTGTITTKQAVVRDGGDAEKRAFGDHEHLPEAADDEAMSPVQRAQAEGKAAAEKLSAEVEPKSRAPKSKKSE